MKSMNIGKLLLMVVLHFIIMFILMYSMVNEFGNIYLNFNRTYMAAIMTAPMLILEVIMMGSMYDNKKILNVILGLSTFGLILFFVFIRQQSFIYDKQFLLSMIPHHSSAILMCNKASLEDNEIKELCRSIINSQQAEIDQMKKILNRIN
jgi:uncharacterized protein (DUF305 family)